MASVVPRESCYELQCTANLYRGETTVQYVLYNSEDNHKKSLKKIVDTFNATETRLLCESVRSLDFTDGNRPKSENQSADSSDEEEPVPDAPPFTFAIQVPPEHPKYRKIFPDVCGQVIQELVHLQQLTELHLAECPLDDVSICKIEFGPAYNLKLLKLDKLDLRRLHPSIGRLRSLVNLSLSYNRLTDLPLTIRLLTKLRKLDISGNPFDRLPGAIFHLKLESIRGLNMCPLKKERNKGWVAENPSTFWRRCLVPKKSLDKVESLQFFALNASVGMDCWKLNLPKRYTEHLTTMAETHTLCEHCLRPVQKLTVQQEAQGYMIHARVALFCGIRDVPFSFMVCGEECLHITLCKLKSLNSNRKRIKGFKRLPACDYKLEYVQDLDEYQRIRADRMFIRAYGRALSIRPSAESSNAPVPSNTEESQDNSNCVFV